MFLASSENNMDASTEEARFVARHFFDLAAFIGQFVRADDGNIYSLTNALKLYGIEFEGTAHSALADAYNLLLLYQGFLANQEVTLRNYMKLLGNTGHLPGPVASVIRALTKGDTVTPEDFRKAAEESLK